MTGGRNHSQGTPQGGVISPLLANVYMNRFLRAWHERRVGHTLRAKMVNYADDFVILCKGTASRALTLARRWMGSMKLTLNEDIHNSLSGFDCSSLILRPISLQPGKSGLLSERLQSAGCPHCLLS
jgi:hypothetical protein